MTWGCFFFYLFYFFYDVFWAAIHTKNGNDRTKGSSFLIQQILWLSLSMGNVCAFRCGRRSWDTGTCFCYDLLLLPYRHHVWLSWTLVRSWACCVVPANPFSAFIDLEKIILLVILIFMNAWHPLWMTRLQSKLHGVITARSIWAACTLLTQPSSYNAQLPWQLQRWRTWFCDQLRLDHHTHMDKMSHRMLGLACTWIKLIGHAIAPLPVPEAHNIAWKRA